MLQNTICHISTVHPSHDSRIFHKQCKFLSKEGYNVVFVVRNDMDEIIDGVKIRALSTPKNRWNRLIKLQLETIHIIREEKPAICHFHDPELIPLGFLLKLMGKKVIYDVHEDYPQSLRAFNRDWLPRWCKGFVSFSVFLMERLSARVFDSIVAATPAIGKNFPQSKTVVVNNYPKLNKSLITQTQNDAKHECSIAYIGSISLIRGVDKIVQSVKLLQDKYKCKLIIAGYFETDHVRDVLCNMDGWKYVEFSGWLSHDDIPSLLKRSGIGVVAFQPAPNHLYSQPHKLFEYMSAGIPVVASDFPHWRDIIEGNQCGLLVDPTNPTEIARAIGWLIDHPQEASEMGKRGQEAVKNKYNWENELKKLMNCYQNL